MLKSDPFFNLNERTNDAPVHYPLLYRSRFDQKDLRLTVLRRGKRDPSLGRGFLHLLPFFPAWKVTLLAWHDFPGVIDVEEHQGDKHGETVENVLVDFMIGNLAVDATRIFDESEDDADLGMNEKISDSVQMDDMRKALKVLP